MLKRLVAALAAITLLIGLAGCGGYNSEFVEREKQQSAKKAATKDSTEIRNLNLKKDLENDPTRVGYVYLLSFGKPFGYYIAKGKISSNGSQLTPEQDIVNPCSTSACHVVVDGPQDDGTYGEGDPGIFFFLTDGKTMVHTNLDYFYSTRPVDFGADVLRLG